jgi:hypothetical protein
VRVRPLLDRSVVPRGSGPVLPRRLSDVSTVWMWTFFSSHVYAARYLYLRFVWSPTRSILYLRLYRARARPFPARLARGPTAIVDRRLAAAGSGCVCPGRPLWGRSALQHPDRPHLCDGGGGISRLRGSGTLKNTRIASGRRRIPHVRIWGGTAVFLSNDHSRTTTVGAARVRVVFWVRP